MDTSTKEDFILREITPLAIPDSHTRPMERSADRPKDEYRSGTLETLFSQNEDLNLRLRLSLRRLAAIEDENVKLAKENKEIRNQYTGLSDQVMVYKEKSDLWQERAQFAEKNLETIESDLRMKEQDFAELRQYQQNQLDRFHTEKEKMETELLRFRRYRARIHGQVRPLVDRLLQNQKEWQSRGQRQDLSIESWTAKVQTLERNEIQLREQMQQEIRAISEEKMLLIQNFEKTRQDLELEINGLIYMTEALQRKEQQLEKSLERQDYLENRVVALERQREDMDDQKQTENGTLVQQLHEWRAHAQRHEAQNTILIEKLRELEHRDGISTETLTRLQDQLEALRSIWNENKEELARLRMGNESLEQLNGELCVKLNEARTPGLYRP